MDDRSKILREHAQDDTDFVLMISPRAFEFVSDFELRASSFPPLAGHAAVAQWSRAVVS